MSFKIVDVFENETQEVLASEVLSIPLIIRQESSTRLLKGSLSDWFGLPAISSGAKPSASLMQGTISSRLGLPELSTDEE